MEANNQPNLDSLPEIDPSEPFVVIDRQTGAVVYRTTYKNRKRARRWADRKDLEHGGIRYIARMGS